MPVMTGELTDAGMRPMTGYRARMLWILNRNTVHGGTVVVNEPVEASLNGTRFSVNVEQTFQGEFYSIRVIYYSTAGDERAPRKVDLPLRVEVPSDGGELGGTGAIPIAPDRVAVGLEQPTQPWPYWLEATLGDPDPGVSTGPGILYRRTD